MKMAYHQEAAPSKKEILGDHLYAKVVEIYPEQAEKITGILLESNVDHILRMLTNESVLCQNAQAAHMCLQNATSLENDASKDDDDWHHLREENGDSGGQDIGEHLFEKVAKLEPSLCAQITGMLLEMDEAFLGGLLEDGERLQAAVEKARRAYLAVCPASSRSRSASSTSSGSELGERVYSEVEKIFPLEAPKITGMLMELSEEDLVKLLDSPTDLQAKILIAHQTLHTAQGR